MTSKPRRAPNGGRRSRKERPVPESHHPMPDFKLLAEMLGTLRSELTNSLGVNVARGILLRFGQRTGQSVARSGRQFTQPPQLGTAACRAALARGLRQIDTIGEFEMDMPGEDVVDPEADTAVLSLTCASSNEAQSHLEACGYATEPACWITSGYITGFATSLCGRDILCIEQECRSSGASACRFALRPTEAWGDESKILLDALANQAKENFSCGKDHGQCSIHEALRSIDNPGLQATLESCLLQVERFGQQMQLEVERKQMELRKRDGFLSNILRDSADGIITVDMNDCIISWNKGAETIYGYTEEEVLGRNIEMLLPLENRKSREPELIRRKLEMEGVIRNFKTQRVTKSGRKIDIILTRTAIRNEAGEVVGSSAVVKDVTQLRSIENQLSRAEHLATMGELAASLAHEIKNPLAGIKGAIEVILDQYEGHRLHRDVLEEVLQEVRRIDRIVQDLLGYARPREPNFTDVNIREVFRRVALLFDRTIEEKKIKLDILIDPDVDSVFADENLIEQVLLNLVLNSLQAMGENGTLVLSNRLTRDVRGVEITVQDSGPGISPENISRVFQPFFTTKKDGTGLGLATCKRIITDHGGTISVASVPGMGATFRIWLPAK